MDANTKTYLLAQDRVDKDEWEAPKEWTIATHEAGLVRVSKLRKALAERYGVEVSMDDGYQDASCFADLGFFVDEECQIIRFSNFDNLAVAFRWTGQRREIQPSPLQAELDQLLRDHAFHPLPPDALNERYDGPAREWWLYDDPDFTWFSRFFDYL